MDLEKGNNIIPISGDRRCLLCGNGDLKSAAFCYDCSELADALEVPKPNEFRNEKHEEIDFLLAPELATIGRKLIENYREDFEFLDDAEIDYFWKRQGGSSGGQSVLGKFIKVSGVVKYYSKRDYLCWLAADHCYGFDLFRTTATVFHELKHGWYNTGTGKWDLKGHVFEGFPREIEVFGPWRSGAQLMLESFEKIKQPRLFSQQKSK